MENKRTAMQVLMEWMIEESQVIPVDPGDVYQKAKELLAMEKEQKENAFNESRMTNPMIGFKHNNFEQYYNETYGEDNG
jgi:hypothetical protein